MAEHELVKLQNERKQGLILEYLSKYPNANMTTLCKLVDISLTCLYNWQKKYPQFGEKMLDVRVNKIEEEIEAAENTVFAASRAGDVHAALQVLKNLGRHKGWGEKLQVEHNLNEQIQSISVNVVRSPQTIVDIEAEEVKDNSVENNENTATT